jgi:hypothetical protein
MFNPTNSPATRAARARVAGARVIFKGVKMDDFVIFSVELTGGRWFEVFGNEYTYWLPGLPGQPGELASLDQSFPGLGLELISLGILRAK